MTNLIVSTIRFSSALTLYTVGQLEQSVNGIDGDSDLRRIVDRFGKTLDSLTGVLMKDIDKNNRETLESVTTVSHEIVHRIMGGMEVMNPGEVLKASTDLLQETSEVIAKWVSRTPNHGGTSPARP